MALSDYLQDVTRLRKEASAELERLLRLIVKLESNGRRIYKSTGDMYGHIRSTIQTYNEFMRKNEIKKKGVIIQLYVEDIPNRYNIQCGNDLKTIGNGTPQLAVPYLAWMCEAHPPEAKLFYAFIKKEFRPYVLADNSETGIGGFTEAATTSQPESLVRFALAPTGAASQAVTVQSTSSMPQAHTQRGRDASFRASEAVHQIINDLASEFVGRERSFNAINEFIERRQRDENSGILILAAPEGYGKSAFAAAWCKSSEKYTDRRVIRHFCRSTHPATTSIYDTLRHLNHQFSRLNGHDLGGGPDEDQISYQLSVDSPDGYSTVLWIDGLDEARGVFPPIIPRQLGKGVSVIVSTRAGPGSLPRYLEPFTKEGFAKSYRHERIDFDRLSISDVKLITDKALAESGFNPQPQNIVERIYQQSESGNALFLKYIIDDIISSFKERGNYQFGSDLSLFSTYIAERLSELRRMEIWPDYDEFFSLLCVLLEPVSRHFLNDVLPRDKRIASLELIPAGIRRWLYIDASPLSYDDTKIYFSHPRIQQAFRVAMSVDVKDMLVALRDTFSTKKNHIQEYRLRYMPYHLLELNDFESFSDAIFDSEFNRDRTSSINKSELTSLRLKEVAKANEIERALGMDNISPDSSRWIKEINMIMAVDRPFGNIRYINLDGEIIRNGFYGKSHNISQAIWVDDLAAILTIGRDNSLRLWNSKGYERACIVKENDQQKIYGAIWIEGISKFGFWGSNFDQTNKSIWVCGLDKRDPVPFSDEMGSVKGAIYVNELSSVFTWSYNNRRLPMALWDLDGKLIRRYEMDEMENEGARWIDNLNGIVTWGEGLRLWRDKCELKYIDSEDVYYAYWSQKRNGLVAYHKLGFSQWDADGRLISSTPIGGVQSWATINEEDDIVLWSNDQGEVWKSDLDGERRLVSQLGSPTITHLTGRKYLIETFGRFRVVEI